MILKNKFHSLLNQEKNKGNELLLKLQTVSNKQDLDAIESEYTSWNEVNIELIKSGLSSSYRHFYDEFKKLDAWLGNAHVGASENRIKKVRHCLEKKTEFLEWMLPKINTLPVDAFNIITDHSPRTETQKKMKRLFISHSSKDKKYVEEMIDLLRSGMSLNQNEIFCSSFEGYSIDLGENFLNRIKTELGSDVIVLFILTQNFYESKICLCEMGATWVNAKLSIPILVPPFDFSDIEGVFPQTQGLKMNDSSKLNSLKEKLEKEFTKQPIHISEWERLKAKFLKNIEAISIQ